MDRGINTRTTPRKPTFRRSISRSVSGVHDFTSRVHSDSRRRSRSGWPGGKTSGDDAIRTRKVNRPATRTELRQRRAGRSEAMKKLAVAALLATTGFAGACSFLGRQAFKQPTVHLQKVAVAGIGLTGGSLNVELSVYNPNNYRLDATQLTYQVMLNSDS